MNNKKQDRIDIKKCEDILDDLQAVFNNAKLNLDELVWVYGQLGYNIGGSLEGKAYNIEALTKLYYEDPRLPIAFMLQGLTIQTWITGEKKDDKANG